MVWSGSASMTISVENALQDSYVCFEDHNLVPTIIGICNLYKENIELIEKILSLEYWELRNCYSLVFIPPETESTLVISDIKIGYKTTMQSNVMESYSLYRFKYDDLLEVSLEDFNYGDSWFIISKDLLNKVL